MSSPILDSTPAKAACDFSAGDVRFESTFEMDEPLLREVHDTIPEYDEARRMLKFLDNFVPMTPDEIPPTSILREFIGGSSFGE